MEKESRAAETTVVAARKRSVVRATPTTSSGSAGGASKPIHHKATGAVSTAAAEKEIASSARGVSMATSGRPLISKARASRSRNATMSASAPYRSAMTSVSHAVNGWLRTTITVLSGRSAKRAISVAAFADRATSSTQKVRELQGSCANQRSTPCERYPRSRSCNRKSSTDGSDTRRNIASGPSFYR